MAKPRVTAGLMWASGLPQAIAAKTPAITATPHPVEMTIHPPPWPLDFVKSTLATVPFPSRTRTRVPMNSPMSRGSMRYKPPLSPTSARLQPLDFPQFRNAADFHPLRYEDVAGVVEDGAMRIDKLARYKLASILGGTRRVSLALTHVDDHLVVLVEQRHRAGQVGDHNRPFVFVEMARLSRALDDVYRFVVQGVAYDAAIASIGD